MVMGRPQKLSNHNETFDTYKEKYFGYESITFQNFKNKDHPNVYRNLEN